VLKRLGEREGDKTIDLAKDVAQFVPVNVLGHRFNEVRVEVRVEAEEGGALHPDLVFEEYLRVLLLIVVLVLSAVVDILCLVLQHLEQLQR